jgi:hypothetical protein
MIARRWLAAFAVAAVLAVAVPWMLLPGGSVPPMPAAQALKPLAVPTPAPLQSAFARPLFGAPAAGGQLLPQDAPALVGVVGRIDRDAVAMVRTADGTARTLAIGESVDGWRLDALAIDAASFSRGRERVRVPLPAGE